PAGRLSPSLRHWQPSAAQSAANAWRLKLRSERWVLSVGQAQKEFTHNESLQTLDLLVAGTVEEPPRTTPPASPSLGACYIVAAEATGAWTGLSGYVVGWTSGGWRAIAPVEGMTLYERSTSSSATYRNGVWELGTLRGSALMIDDQKVVGGRLGAIESPSGGAVVDVEGRAVIAAILAALRTHG